MTDPSRTAVGGMGLFGMSSQRERQCSRLCWQHWHQGWVHALTPQCPPRALEIIFFFFFFKGKKDISSKVVSEFEVSLALKCHSDDKTKPQCFHSSTEHLVSLTHCLNSVYHLFALIYI